MSGLPASLRTFLFFTRWLPARAGMMASTCGCIAFLATHHLHDANGEALSVELVEAQRFGRRAAGRNPLDAELRERDFAMQLVTREEIEERVAQAAERRV